MIDSLILTVGFALLSWVFLVAPNIHLSGLSLLAKLVSVAYPLGDILLLAALIRLAVDSGRRTTSFYLLRASTVALLATDCAYNYALLAGNVQPSADLRRRLDRVPRAVGCGCAASVDAAARAADRGCAGAADRVRLGLLALACLIAPGIHFAQDIGSIDLLVVISASAGLFLLVVARMAGLVRQEERARLARRRFARPASCSLPPEAARTSTKQSWLPPANWSDRKPKYASSSGRTTAGGSQRRAAAGWDLPPEAADQLRQGASPPIPCSA